MIRGRHRDRETGAVVHVLALAVNASDGHEGEVLVVYHPDDNEHSIIVRKEAEFDARFESMQRA